MSVYLSVAGSVSKANLCGSKTFSFENCTAKFTVKVVKLRSRNVERELK